MADKPKFGAGGFFRKKNEGEDEGQVGIKPPSSAAKFTPCTTTLSPCPWLYTPEDEAEEDEGGKGKEGEGDKGGKGGGIGKWKK